MKSVSLLQLDIVAYWKLIYKSIRKQVSYKWKILDFIRGWLWACIQIPGMLVKVPGGLAAYLG